MKPLGLHIILTLFIVGFSNLLFAQQTLTDHVEPSSSLPVPLVLNDLAAIDSLPIADQLEILIDKTATLDLEDVLSDAKGATFQALIPEQELDTKTVYWGRMTIENQIDATVAPSEWVLSFSSLLTAIEVYVLDTTLVSSQSTGTFHPISTRDFSPISDQNLVKITIPPNSRRLVYFRAKSDINQSQKLRAPKLQSLENSLTELANEKKTSGFFIGFLAMILGYSLILYFFQRDQAYLYYSGYVLALILWWSFNRGELLDLPLLGFLDRFPQYVYFFKLATYFGLFSYLAFILTFLDLKKLLPWWHKVFKIMIWVGVPLLLIDAFILWNTNFSLSTADQLSVFYILSFVILTYFFLWPLYKTRDPRGIFIILGMLAMGGGFLMTAIHRFSTSGFTLTYFQIGTFIEVTIFSLGLAYRSNLVFKERQQAAFDLEKSKIKEQKKESESRQLRELNEIKTRFYTNITHEFRTPLTVIMGMAEQLKENQETSKPRAKLNQGLQLIHRNSQQLLGLINQLLDLSKLDSGNLKLDLVQTDIVAYLQYLTESFYSMAEEKDVRLVFYPEKDAIVMDFDEDKIQQIVYNLLSNAVKFTPAIGKIVFHVSETQREGHPHLQLRIKDSGIGIATDQLPYVFDRFYQTDNSSTRKVEGSGIGLALTKELVNLMGGNIEVESTPGKGSIFQIDLPIHQTASLPEKAKARLAKNLVATSISAIEPTINTDPILSDNSDLPILLLIEDNFDVATYIENLLETDYTIHRAENGQLGIDQAVTLVPDIIISDVMMPEKDGYEVCKTLKTDERTSHIPIILLTARATQADRLEGLKYGADAYLTKPFHKNELLIRLEQLVEIRQKLKARFSNYLEQANEFSSKPTTTDAEATFLQNVRETILEHLEDVDFGVPQLAKPLGMSQMQVYRKLKALVDKTPSQFIRSVRLQKGKVLLQTTNLTISEVAYDVGFSDPNYFSRTFHQEFKQPPSHFRK